MAATATIFKGAFAKILAQSGFEFKDGTRTMAGALDPTVTAVDAPKGSSYLSTSTGRLYQKQDAGSSTNWNAILTGGDDIITPVVQAKDTNGITFKNSLGTAYGTLNHSGVWQFNLVNIDTLGNVTIPGDLTVQGTKFITETETVRVKDNTIVVNDGETGVGVSANIAGLRVDRGTLDPFAFVFNEVKNNFRVGEQVFEINTAQGGGASTITLHASTSHASQTFYNSKRVTITAGTGAGQTRSVAATGNNWDNTTKILTLSTTWTTNPDSTSEYEILITDDTQAVATREDAPIQGGLAVWETAFNGFVTTTEPLIGQNITFSQNTFANGTLNYTSEIFSFNKTLKLSSISTRLYSPGDANYATFALEAGGGPNKAITFPNVSGTVFTSGAGSISTTTFRNALTGSTGTGSPVFGTSPTITDTLIFTGTGTAAASKIAYDGNFYISTATTINTFGVFSDFFGFKTDTDTGLRYKAPGSGKFEANGTEVGSWDNAGAWTFGPAMANAVNGPTHNVNGNVTGRAYFTTGGGLEIASFCGPNGISIGSNTYIDNSDGFVKRVKTGATSRILMFQSTNTATSAFDFLTTSTSGAAGDTTNETSKGSCSVAGAWRLGILGANPIDNSSVLAISPANTSPYIGRLITIGYDNGANSTPLALHTDTGNGFTYIAWNAYQKLIPGSNTQVYATSLARIATKVVSTASTFDIEVAAAGTAGNDITWTKASQTTSAGAWTFPVSVTTPQITGNTSLNLLGGGTANYSRLAGDSTFGSYFLAYGSTSGNANRADIYASVLDIYSQGTLTARADTSFTIFKAASVGNNTLGETVPALVLNKSNAVNNRILSGYDAATRGYVRINSSQTNLEFEGASDRRIKTDIEDLSNALNKVLAVRPVSFKIKENQTQSQGFIAQEFSEVFPTAVTKTDDGLGEDLPEGTPSWTMSDAILIPYLTKAIQEQQLIIQELRSRIESLESRSI